MSDYFVRDGPMHSGREGGRQRGVCKQRVLVRCHKLMFKLIRQCQFMTAVVFKEEDEEEEIDQKSNLIF